jgi:hypothetical protein
MTKLTREQFIAVLESGKYEKIESNLYKGIAQKSGKAAVCAIGAALTETGMKSVAPAPGFAYFPAQLVKDLEMTTELERQIFTTNDRNPGDNWKSVVELLRKTWDIQESTVNLYEAEQLLEAYFTGYYQEEIQPVENFGYQV